MEKTVEKKIYSINLRTIPNDICKDDICTKSQAWTGFFLMKNNLWFEGIVKNDGFKSNNLKDSQLIIGNLIGFYEIELMKYDHLTFSSHYFTAVFDNKKLNGDVNLYTPTHDIYFLGKCEILVNNVKMNDSDIKKLEQEINKFKLSTNNSNKLLIEEFSANQNAPVMKKIKN
jgi:hypothetical protein